MEANFWGNRKVTFIIWSDSEQRSSREKSRAQIEVPPNTPQELAQETLSRLFKGQFKVRRVSGAKYVVIYVAVDEIDVI